MIPKGGGKDFRGIELVEVLWKFTTGIIKRHLTSTIHYHDTLHGFQKVVGWVLLTLRLSCSNS